MDRTFTCHGSSFLPVSLFVLLAFGISQLQAQTLIYSLPFFILFPAKYRLVKNLTYEGKQGSAIMILSSNGDIDLNGCALKETAADNQSIGVLIDHQQNVPIRNGKIQGFKQAIVFDDHTKQITWPGNDLASHNVAIQSVDASQEAPVDAERKTADTSHIQAAKKYSERSSYSGNFWWVPRPIRRDQKFTASFSEFCASPAQEE